MPGRELRSMAWMQAYLLAAPNAPNADAVRKEIVALKVRVKGTLEKMVSGAAQMAGQFTKVWDRENGLQRIAVAQARAGDFDGALQTARKGAATTVNSGDVNEALMKIAVIQYNAGDRAGAMDTVRTMETVNWDKNPWREKDAHSAWTSRACRFIADLQAAAGDFSKAEATCERSDLFDRIEALHILAWMEAIAGKRDDALAHAEKTVTLSVEAAARTTGVPNTDAVAKIQPILFDIATLQAILGDSTAAKKTDALFLDKQRKGDTRAEIFLKGVAESRDPTQYRENALLHHFDYNSEESWLGSITEEAGLFHRRPKSTVSGAVDLINKYLSAELFTDPRSALQAIAVTPHRKTQFYEPETNEQFDGIVAAILQIADALDAVMKLGR
jgi:hypothetical protein